MSCQTPLYSWGWRCASQRPPPAGSPNPTGSRAAVLGEFGGLGHRVADHQWIPEDSFSYEMEDTLPLLQTRYEGLVEQVRSQHCSRWYSCPEFLPWGCGCRSMTAM